ncbi:Alpha-amylase [Mycena venus]|uniref:Alpha-amylase n=1 Tax=Mycena venus TaxID=2733690 RepID=A0A8H7DCS9_9AGAR|nr:Alpha-amylase [Mycena venus]
MPVRHLTVTPRYSWNCDARINITSARLGIVKAKMWPSLLPLLAWSVQSTLAFPTQLNSTVDVFESRAPSGSKTVIIQMFEWTWDSIAAECTNFIGPAGYGFVQVSPPQEHITGSQWWTDYQPVSYILTSKRGNQAQFQSMISTCHAAGVKVISDTLFNHMTASNSGTGIAGSSYTYYNYPGIYQNQDFHHCGLEPNDDIVNYDNRLEVQTCQLDGLADLATNTTYVQSVLAAYGNHLISLGVDGFRLDAAKHIAATEIATILSLLTSKPYITQEVIWGAGEPIQPSEYVGNDTTALQTAFSGGGISSLQNLDSMGWVSGSQANVFVANHDTERNGDSLNINSPSNTYITATIFSLAHSYGTPTILSSYSYSTIDDGAPNGGVGTCSATGGANGWLCQHRFVAITGMVGFRNQVGSAAITNWVSPQSQQIAFGRGSAGFVAINNADSAWTMTFTTSLPNNAYCDVISGTSSNGVCTGAGFSPSPVVSSQRQSRHAAPSRSTRGNSGRGSGTGTGTGSGTVAVSWAETATTTFGENIFLVGSISQLGTWDPTASLPLSAATYPIWTITVNLPPNTSFQYKFIRKETDGSVVWESDPNRSATTNSSGSQTISTSWR